MSLARKLMTAGALEEAEDLLREVLSILSRESGAEQDLVHCLSLLGWSSFLRGTSLDETEKLVGQAAATSRTHEIPAWQIYQSFLGFMLGFKGAYDEAETLCREALAMFRRLGDELLGGRELDFGFNFVTNSLSYLAFVLFLRGSYEEAERLHLEALARSRRQIGADHPSVGQILLFLALLKVRRGAHEEAEDLLREALAIKRRKFGDEHVRVGQGLAEMASLRLAQGRYGEAKGVIRQALEILRETLPAGSFWIARSEAVLGAALAGLGRYEEAEPLLVTGYEMLRDKAGVRCYLTLQALDGLGMLYESWGKPEKAAEYRALGPKTTVSRS